MSSKLLVALVVCAFVMGCSKKGGGPTNPGPTGPGSLRIVTIPGSATASVIVSGATATGYTPALFDGVDSGPAAVDLSMMGYADTVVVLTVPAGGTVVDTVRLRPLAGTPTVIEEVWEAFFAYVGPLGLGSNGNFYVTAQTSTFITVLAVLAPSGAILRQSLQPDPDANPAFDIALDSRNYAFVAGTSYGNDVSIFDADGLFVTSFSRRQTFGSDGIAGIAIGAGDTVHVSARYGSVPVIEKYTNAGSFVSAFETGSFGPGPVEVGTDGTIYVGSDFNSSTPQIRKFGRTGTVIQTWSVGGPPKAITRGPGNTLYVTSLLGGDVPSNAVQAPSRMEIFNAEGMRLAQWGIENRSIAYLDRHAVSSTGTIYLPLRNDRRVLTFASQ